MKNIICPTKARYLLETFSVANSEAFPGVPIIKNPATSRKTSIPSRFGLNDVAKLVSKTTAVDKNKIFFHPKVSEAHPMIIPPSSDPTKYIELNKLINHFLLHTNSNSVAIEKCLGLVNSQSVRLVKHLTSSSYGNGVLEVQVVLFWAHCHSGLRAPKYITRALSPIGIIFNEQTKHIDN